MSRLSGAAGAPSSGPTTALTRRALLRGVGASAVTLAGGAGLASCSGGGSDGEVPDAGGDVRPVRIGYVTPQSGALAAYAGADAFVTAAIQAFADDQGLPTGAGRAGLGLFLKDTASDPVRAAEVATELVTQEQVDVVVVAATPETTNPVADVCESAGVPCVSTGASWQSWFLARGASLVSSFRWTYHFFGGIGDVASVFLDMADAVGSNRLVGTLWPDDLEGTTWGDPADGLPSILSSRGYQISDPGFYQSEAQDFSPFLAQFREQGVQLLLGVPVPPDFATFWDRAEEEDFRPQLVAMGRALQFPSAVQALGSRGHNLATDVSWSPTHPFRSSLTGQTAGELAQAFQDSSGDAWIQPLGLVHALFEVAVAALAAADGPDDRDGIADALASMSLDTVCGTVDFTAGPVRNVSTLPLVGGQWRVADRPAPELVVVSNAQALSIPAAGQVEPLG
ncbi:MAG: ABC transporter substrate-binding protein [Kineosporiaceae bacterium]